MENENVIGKVCFAILRKGFVAGLRISLELDSPGCIIGCKFDGALFLGQLPSISAYLIYLSAAVLSAGIGLWFFSRVRKGFADVL